MQRVAVVGSSGAGKSWLASRLAAALGVPYVEFDAIHHGPGWAALPADEMRSMLERLCPADGAWVADGNYARKGGEGVRARADTIVWLDFPRGMVMRQLAIRTFRRIGVRQQLWNGNRESLRDVLARDPERSILRWAWTRHQAQRTAYAAQLDARWIRLTSRSDVRRFLAGVERGSRPRGVADGAAAGLTGV
jgi:adenylate kinase family enzyme